MKQSLLIALPLLSIAAHGYSPSLIGGVKAKKNEFKSTVFINQACTASKIGSRTFLTAAHCVLDMKSAQISSYFKPGTKINIQTHYMERAVLTIEETHAHSSFVNVLKKKLSKKLSTYGLAIFSYDIAAFTVKEETPLVPEVRVDLERIEVGEKVIVGGYGCEISINEKKLTVGTLKTGLSKVMSEENSSKDLTGRDLSQANHFNFYSAGMKMNPEAPSLCHGDSGGPVYRASNNEVIGVNSQYLMKDSSGVSYINTHTRLSEIGEWLTPLIR